MTGLLISFSIVSSVLALPIIYAVAKKQLSKKYLLIPIYIGLCVFIAFYYNDVALFGLLGVLGVAPFINLLKGKNKKND